MIDELRKMKKNFKCKWKIIKSHMCYFEQYLKDENSNEQLDISVHCDVKIFEWLIKYVDYLQNFKEFGNVINLYRTSYMIMEEDQRS